MAEVMSGELAIRVIFLHTCLIQHILECDWEDRKVDGVGLPVVPWTVQWGVYVDAVFIVELQSGLKREIECLLHCSWLQETP